MKLEEIRNNPEIMANLRFDLTPEKLAIHKDAQFDPENAGYYFCIYLRGSKPCLALLHYLPGGTATQDCIAGFPEDLVNEVLRDILIEKLLRMGYSLRNADQKPLSKLTVRQLLTDFPEVKEALRDAKWSEGQYYPINKPIQNLLRMGLYGANRNAKLKDRYCEQCGNYVGAMSEKAWETMGKVCDICSAEGKV